MPCPDGVDARVWTDFLAVRKAKGSPLTATALAGIEREALKAGYTLEDALRTSCERGWQGFKADWVAPRNAGQPIQQPQRMTNPAMGQHGNATAAAADRLKQRLFGAGDQA